MLLLLLLHGLLVRCVVLYVHTFCVDLLCFFVVDVAAVVAAAVAAVARRVVVAVVLSSSSTHNLRLPKKPRACSRRSTR